MARTVFITGCSSGIGRAGALAFLDAGWNVVATMRDPAKWDGPTTDRLLTRALDVIDAASIAHAADAAVGRFGRVDCVVNNAGQALLSVVEATPVGKAQAIFDINLFGTLRVMHAFVPRFRVQGGGRFVNVSSGSAITPDPFMAIYAASKFAVEGLTEGMRFELSRHGVSLKLIEPGYVPATGLGAAVMANAEGLTVPAAYQTDLDAITAAFTGPPPAHAAKVEEVAAAMLVAAEDASDTLRFTVGKDAAEAAHMRRETDEATYLRWATARFNAQT